MKRGFLLIGIFVSFMLLIIGVHAQANNSGNSGGVIASGSGVNVNSAADKAYACLKEQIDDKRELSLEEAIFSALAVGNYGNVSKIIDNGKSASENCWPKNGCKLKETAQVALAYQSMGKNTDSIKSWLLSKSKNAIDLAWYLEVGIENQKASECTLKYDTGNYKINIDADQKITGSSGPCLSVSSSGYLLKVRNTCLDRTFEVSCKESFISTLIYQRDLGNGADCLDENNLTCFVLPDTHSASSLGTTSEKVDAQCFTTGTNCDFEGTLWTTIALNKLNARNNATRTLPYLTALINDYKRYMPEAFLLILTGNDDYYNILIQNRKQGLYWEADNSLNNRFYDTSVGMLGIGSSSSKSEIASTQGYLAGIQTKEGCWNNNNVRDTAFILYSGWPKNTIKSGGSGGSDALCQEAGFSCERVGDCQNAGGNVLDNFQCVGVGKCCSIKIEKASCSSQNGNVCTLSQECNGKNVESKEGACCVGSCVAITSNVCELATDALCKSECGDGEVATSDSCGSSGEVCCVAFKGDGGSNWWIWVLAALVILVVLGIVFKDKLRLFLFKFKNDVKSESVSRPGQSSNDSRPAGPGPRPPTGPRFGSPPRSMPPQRAPVRPLQRLGNTVDKEMSETLRKLKEMSE
ncbi:MAG: hypothetical protein Q7R87_04095 [Nanoarchaeota archaeon]|nr:hypothetical protein [Nanoarchaeota archaeon]